MAKVGTVKHQPNEVQDYDITFVDRIPTDDVITAVTLSCTPAMPTPPLCAPACSKRWKKTRNWTSDACASADATALPILLAALVALAGGVRLSLVAEGVGAVRAIRRGERPQAWAVAASLREVRGGALDVPGWRRWTIARRRATAATRGRR